VLPVLFGERFVGRIEMAYDRKAERLDVKNIWYEPEIGRTKTLEHNMDRALVRFERFCKSGI